MQSAGNKRETSLLSSAAPICSESAGGALFTRRCMRVCVCVKRGAGRKGTEKKGVERWKGRDGRGRKGGRVEGTLGDLS